MAQYVLASEKHWALYPGRSKVTAGPVSNSLVPHCHKYWTVPYPTWKPSIECCRISFFYRTYFLSHENTKCYRTYIFFLSHESIKNIESNVLFYRTYFSYRMKLLKISNQMFSFIEHIFFYRMNLLKISNQIFFIEHDFYRILLPFGRHTNTHTHTLINTNGDVGTKMIKHYARNISTNTHRQINFFFFSVTANFCPIIAPFGLF